MGDQRIREQQPGLRLSPDPARGYKFIDSYSDQLGYGSQKFGASITAIIDPSAEGVRRIRCFPDLEEAAEFLTWKRSR
jgi:hypothetical protein